MQMSPTAVFRAGPEDLIATTWFSLGFKPTESLVLAGLEGSRNRIGVILRADLPGPPVSGSLLRDLVRGSIGPIVDSPADAVVAMIVSERALTDPGREIISLLRRQVAVLGLDLFDVLGVTSSAYRSLICSDPGCCPAEGKPIEAVMASRSAATHVLNGDLLVETAEELLRDVRPEPGLDPVPGPVLRSWHPTPGGLGRLSPEQRRQWWENWVDAFTAAETVARTTAEKGGSVGTVPVPGLSGALHDPYLRDAVLMHLLGAPQAQLSSMLRPDPAGVPIPDLGELLARHPDRQRLSDGQSVLAGAARVAAPGDRAPSLAVLALLAWYEGRGGLSRLLAERARDDAPAVSLISLVEDLLLRQLPPPWAQIGQEG
jgi:Domain of unknown function (DUF4192)